MSASSPLSAVENMLEKCAPGYTIRLANHSRVIHFDGKVYRTFPKHDPVENGHIRKMVRYLGISTSCASKCLPGVIKDDEEKFSKALTSVLSVKPDDPRLSEAKDEAPSPHKQYKYAPEEDHS